MSPKISVIINCYNSGMYLKQCIDSVLKQTYQNFEVIFWDNCSTDDSAFIAKSFDDDRVIYILAPTHTTLGYARNLAMEHATGDWVAFLDCDDFWHPQKLEHQYSAIQSSTENLGFVYTDVDLVCESGSNIVMANQYSKLVRGIINHSEKCIYSKMLNGNYIIFSSVLMRRDLFLALGGVNPNFQQNEDYDILIRMSEICTTACCSGKLTSYRIHSNNNSISNNLLHFEETVDIFSRLSNSNKLDRAKKLNRTRQGLYFIIQGSVLKGVSIILSKGSLLSLLAIIKKRMSHDKF